MIVDILGTEYTVTRNTSAIEGMGADGICQAYNRKIIYRDLKDFLEDIDSVSAKKLRRDEVIRHEVIHAFFAESGLSKYGDDEVLVDWIAKQMPKINEAVNKILKSEEYDLLKKGESYFKNDPKEKCGVPVLQKAYPDRHAFIREYVGK